MRILFDKKYDLYFLFFLIILSTNSFNFLNYKEKTVDPAPNTSVNPLAVYQWGASNTDDRCEGSAIYDSTQDLFLVGSTNKSGNYDILLLKYDKNGNLLKNVTWDNGRDDFGMDVAIDQSTGYIYVVGYTNSSLKYDVVVLKFGNDCSFKWQYIYNNASVNDYGYGIAVPASDSIYMTGRMSNHIGIIKLNETGNLKWRKLYDSDGFDSAYEIYAKNVNELYVSGIDNPSFPMPGELILLKYNSTGDLQWKRSDSGAVSALTGYSIALDSQNYIYVIGREGTGGGRLFIAKYRDDNTNAVKIGLNYYLIGSKGYYGNDIAIDKNDDLYIASYLGDPNTTLCLSIYNSSLGLKKIDGYGGSEINVKEAKTVVIDSNNQIYNSRIITNKTTGSNDILITKYIAISEEVSTNKENEEENKATDEDNWFIIILIISLIGAGIAAGIAGVFIYLKFIKKEGS
ncbi:MAG: hypothetical protein ACTSQP_19795 [Promethearchaeota archaeon]